MISFVNKLKNTSFSPVLSSFSVLKKLAMSTSVNVEKSEGNPLKREFSKVDTDGVTEEPEKKALVVKEERVKRRKIAMLISYLGTGYLGLQRNPGTKTIEEDLLQAMLKAGFINEDIYNQPQAIQFQRAARTDKGVSALRQVLSMRLPENSNTDAINEHLPEQIRAMGILRVTKGFNCKSSCDGRTYSYTSPTFAFAPHNLENPESYRLTDQVREQVTEVLKLYVGTHNFHNFTSKRLPTDPSSSRYMMSFICEDPVIVDGMEFVTLKVKGQSFMLHQIRKMVGLMIAIVRGLTTSDTITKAYEKDKLDIPIAPGLGLLLEEVHYDRYNVRYGSDGMHEAIDWSNFNKQVEEFSEKFILPTIVETEKKEKSMLSWIETLNMHTFDIRSEHVHMCSELDAALEKQGGLLSPPRLTDPLEAVDIAC